MLELKFIPLDEYQQMQKEAVELMEEKRAALVVKSKELEELQVELAPLALEVEELKKFFELKKWCGNCKDRRKSTCDSRLAYSMAKKTTKKTSLVVMIEVMRDEPPCKKA